MAMSNPPFISSAPGPRTTPSLTEQGKSSMVPVGQTVSWWPMSTTLRGPVPNRQKTRSEEHTSELQSRFDLVCRLLLEKKKKHPSKGQAHRKQSRQAYRRMMPQTDNKVA